MRRILTIILLLLAVVLVAGAAWLYTPDQPRAALEAKYAPPPSRFVEAAGVRLHVRDTGKSGAPVIVLLHGFGSSLHTWEPWAQALEPDFRVIRLDLPGFGLTGADPSADYTDERTIAVLAALMDKLGVERASIIGNSMGGRFAWKFAAAYPNRVEKLVLISPDGFASPGIEYGKKQSVPAVMGLMKYAMPRSMLKASLVPAYGNPAALGEDVVTRYYDLMLAPGVRGAILARMEQSVLVDPQPLLKQITAPVLLVWGEKDQMIPFTNAADYTRTLPKSEIVSFPELGHVPHEEAPGPSVEPVRKFLMR